MLWSCLHFLGHKQLSLKKFWCLSPERHQTVLWHQKSLLHCIVVFKDENDEYNWVLWHHNNFLASFWRQRKLKWIGTFCASITFWIKNYPLIVKVSWSALLLMNSMKLVFPLHSLYWSIHTKDESKRETAFAFIFGVNWLWRCGVAASFGVFFSWNKM